MKLISNFHDYYDSIFKVFESDPTYVFKRLSTEIKMKNKFDIIFSPWLVGVSRHILCSTKNLELHELGCGILIFCGKPYPFIKTKLVRIGDNVNVYDKELNPVYCYTLDQFCHMLEKYELPYSKKHKTIKHIEEWLTGDEQFNHNWRCCYSEKLMDELLSYSRRWAYYVYENNSATMLTYPILKNFQFQKNKDVHTCFQDISMYLSNVVTIPDKDVWDVPDKIKAQSHGFDKYSFRKDKL